MFLNKTNRVLEKLSKQWDQTGLVIENDGHDKYTVKVDGSGRVRRNRRYLRSFKPMDLRLPGTRTLLPEMKIESDGRNTDTMQDHTKTRVNYEPQGGSEEIQMEPVDPATNPPENPVVSVAQEDPVLCRSTRVPRPKTKYSSAEFQLT